MLQSHINVLIMDENKMNLVREKCRFLNSVWRLGSMSIEQLYCISLFVENLPHKVFPWWFCFCYVDLRINVPSSRSLCPSGPSEYSSVLQCQHTWSQHFYSRLQSSFCLPNDLLVLHLHSSAAGFMPGVYYSLQFVVRDQPLFKCFNKWRKSPTRLQVHTEERVSKSFLVPSFDGIHSAWHIIMC